MVNFRLQFERKRDASYLDCRWPAHLTKSVKNSSGESEQRPFVSVPIRIGSYQWTIEASLTDRREMVHRMLLGRSALSNRFMVDPAKTLLFGVPESLSTAK